MLCSALGYLVLSGCPNFNSGESVISISDGGNQIRFEPSPFRRRDCFKLLKCDQARGRKRRPPSVSEFHSSPTRPIGETLGSWGRTVNENIQKFLQFQLSVNFSGVLLNERPQKQISFLKVRFLPRGCLTFHGDHRFANTGGGSTICICEGFSFLKIEDFIAGGGCSCDVVGSRTAPTKW